MEFSHTLQAPSLVSLVSPTLSSNSFLRLSHRRTCAKQTLAGAPSRCRCTSQTPRIGMHKKSWQSHDGIAVYFEKHLLGDWCGVMNRWRTICGLELFTAS